MSNFFQETVIELVYLVQNKNNRHFGYIDQLKTLQTGFKVLGQSKLSIKIKSF